MNIASRHAAAIRSTAIAIIATTTAVMTIGDHDRRDGGRGQPYPPGNAGPYR